MEDYVIKRVEYLSEEEKQPVMHNGMTSLEWAPGIDVNDALEDDHHE